MSDVNYSDDPSALTPASLAAIRNRLQPQVMLQPVDHDPFAEVPGVGVVPTAVPAAARAVGEGMASWAAAPGNVYRGQQPQVPGQWSDEDEARAQLNASGQYQWGPETATMMVGGGSPFAEEGAVGAAGGGIRAFHGSPYDFERFDLSKIGTGEGAQAYGHGLYFGGNENTALTYKNAPRVTDMDWPIKGDNPDWRVPSWVGRTVQSYPSGIDDMIKDFSNRVIESKIENPQNVSGLQNIVDALNAVKAGKAELQKPGKMYEVNINADPEHFLDWDKPLSEQHPNVVSALRNAGVLGGNDPETLMRKELFMRMNSGTGQDEGPALQKWYDELKANEKQAFAQDNDALSEQLQDKMRIIEQWWQHGGTSDEERSVFDPTGRELLQQLEQRLSERKNIVGSRNPPSASETLRDAGIPGIKYLDQGSRDISGQVESAQQSLDYWKGIGDPDKIATSERVLANAQKMAQHGTSNYVVFNDKLIDIVKKYGLAGLIAGGGAHFSLQPTDAQPEFE